MLANSLSRIFLQPILLTVCILATVGCEKSPPAQFRFNEVHWKVVESTNLSDGETYDDSYKKEIGTILTAVFGTPDEPKFPFLFGEESPAHEIISVENLKMSAGPSNTDKDKNTRGLYREHCAHCHGITGDGAGPTAESLNPYPRDFRLSKFKFKATGLSQSPTDHDLRTILVNGIPGTAMPSFRTLPDEEIDSLIDYVKYLTIRGKFERFLISEVANVEEGRPLIDMSLKMDKSDGEPASDDDIEDYEDQMFAIMLDGLEDGIISRWVNPDKKTTEIEPAPPQFNPEHSDHEQFVDQGRKLFYSKGNCMQCHGETGSGDGTNDGYDAWTLAWFNAPGIDKADPSTYAEYIAAGALPPRNIAPRNLHVPIYHGGDHPNDLFLRLTNGIEGTPMPDASAMQSDEVWKIVAYIRALPYENKNVKEPLPVNDKAVGQ